MKNGNSDDRRFSILEGRRRFVWRILLVELRLDSIKRLSIDDLRPALDHHAFQAAPGIMVLIEDHGEGRLLPEVSDLFGRGFRCEVNLRAIENRTHRNHVRHALAINGRDSRDFRFPDERQFSSKNLHPSTVCPHRPFLQRARRLGIR